MNPLRRDAHFDMKGVLRPRASITWEAPLEVSHFERGTAQPLVTLKRAEETITTMNGAIKEGTGDLVLPYTPIQIKFTDLLLPAPAHLLEAQAFRSLWDRLGQSINMDGVIEQTGHSLSERLAYEVIRGPDSAIGYVGLPEIPTGSHIQAAGLCQTWSGEWLAFYCIGACTVHPSEEKTPADATATATPENDTVTPTPTPVENAVWRVQYEFRSTSEQVIDALRQNGQQWLDDLTEEQVRVVNVYGNCMDENYRKTESVMFPGLSNLQIESNMSTDDILYKWNVMKRNRKNRYVELSDDEEAEEHEDEE